LKRVLLDYFPTKASVFHAAKLVTEYWRGKTFWLLSPRFTLAVLHCAARSCS